MIDREDFTRMLTTHQRVIHTCIRSLVPNLADVDEIWQETNVRLWQKAEQFQPGTNFRAWALTVAQFEVRNFRRRQQVRSRVLSDVMVEQLAEELLLRSEAEQSRLAALRHCLAKLRPQDRQLIEMRYQAGARGATLAQRLGRSLDAIYRSVTRIRRGLLECIRCQLAQEEHV